MKKTFVNHLDHIRETEEQLAKGAFLTVQADGIPNTMTISWGSVGHMWNRPIFTVMVRPQRRTFELLEKAGHFTVSLPVGQGMEEALAYCGSNSGRDRNKFKECDLHLEEGEKVDSPVISNARLHYECQVVAKHPLTEEGLDPELVEKFYPRKDYHMMFYGKILSCYLLEE
ncbi:flavin reductase family protein [Anaerotalea alkaliphila]|uniref:Flavin reductase family protein n=1 Tax=Anaerotalea alkaliphila TaxID=2662126 RepID=A0A7X5HUX8_9FIRM|nr:flavin reductase family protein [Anaerotalea alkaliphila]NDL67104.1 flavin reductase family protein [Anaerotalea alkaliphila]